jgi:hypothetical protein
VCVFQKRPREKLDTRDKREPWDDYARYGILIRVPPELLKPVVWVGDSLRVLKSFPSSVQDEVGYALFLAQRGEKHIAAKPLKGLGGGCTGSRR